MKFWLEEDDMEFWLKQDDLNEGFQLPVNPGEYEKSMAGNNGSIDIEDYGELTFLGYRKLATINISSFFPKTKYNFCICEPKDDPYEYIKMIEGWQDKREPVRLIITETPINMLCSIESFSYKEEGGCRDVSFSLDLKEYRIIKPTILDDTASSDQTTLIKEVQHDLQRLSCLKSGEENVTGKLDDATRAAIKEFKYIVDLTGGTDIDENLTTALNAIVKKPTIGYGWPANTTSTKFVQWWLGITPKDGIFSTSMSDKVKAWQIKAGIWSESGADGVIREKDWNVILK